jgi:hypothetical protein
MSTAWQVPQLTSERVLQQLLTVIEESMTGTACGDTYATLKLKKAPF